MAFSHFCIIQSSLVNPLRLVELMPLTTFFFELRLIGSRVGRLAFSAKLRELRGPLFIMGDGEAKCIMGSS